jgi:hypothetical protein
MMQLSTTPFFPFLFSKKIPKKENLNPTKFKKKETQKKKKKTQ